MGQRADIKSLIAHFRLGTAHFRTYPDKRDASFSASCNALRAMLEASDIDAHLLDIESTLEYLCESWWNGHFEDKWVSSTRT